MDAFVTKGTRVQVDFLQADNPPGSLAGAQLKFTAKKFLFTGTVRHVRADAPTQAEAKDIRFWIEPTFPIDGLRTEFCSRCQCQEVPGVSPGSILNVLP